MLFRIGLTAIILVGMMAFLTAACRFLNGATEEFYAALIGTIVAVLIGIRSLMFVWSSK